MENTLYHALIDALETAPIADSAPPWQLVAAVSAGGATAAGFDPATDDLLVVSSNGQGVFDTATGSRVYRNRNESGYNPERLEADRLDRTGGRPIPMAGDDGGGLRRSTSDGWTIDILQISWPTSYSVVQRPGASIYFVDPRWDRFNKDASFHVLKKSEGLPIAFGFSWSGRSLIWLDRSDLFIWRRDD